MEYRELAIESLLLDTQNPRHEPVDGQREAIKALLDARGAPQLLRLAQDIAEFGPSPIELALVVPTDSLFAVVEGNRRVAAMKLLKNPRLADGSKIAKQIYELSKRSVPLEHMGCIVASSRDEARRWIELRHKGIQGGVGIVDWSPEMQVRFSGIYSAQRGRALLLTDALENAYQNDRELLALIETVKAAKLTTLGRLVSDPAFRAGVGVEILNGELRSQFPPSALRALWYKLLRDLDTHLSVSSLKNKEQRAAYLASLADVQPTADARRPAAPLDEEPEAEPANTKARDDKPGAATPKRSQNQRARPMRLFYDVQFRNVQPKTRDVLREAQRIELTKFPNAGAVLIRVLVEMVVGEVVQHRKLQVGDALRERINKCLAELDPTGKAGRYLSIRQAVSNRDSPLAVGSIQAYLHNPLLHPDPGALRAVSDNYGPFLIDLDTLLGSP